MNWISPAVATAVGAGAGVMNKVDNKASRWYCGAHEYRTYYAAAALAGGAGLYKFTDVNPDISYGMMVPGMAFLAHRAGLRLGRGKQTSANGGAGCGCTNTCTAPAARIAMPLASNQLRTPCG